MKKFGTITIALALGLGIGLTGFTNTASAATKFPTSINCNQSGTSYQNVLSQLLPSMKQQFSNQQTPIQIQNQQLPFKNCYSFAPQQFMQQVPQQAPVQQAPVQQQPVKQAPVQQAPVQAQTPATNQNQSSAAPVTQEAQPQNEQSAASFTKQVADLVNQERAKAGLAPLQFDAALSKVAAAKAADMEQNHYFDHISPTYGSPFDMMKQFGISFMTAGENIAMGQRSPQEVMTQWMNSEGHRQNIMNGSFTKIGVGYVNGYWVQEFAG